MASGGSGMRRRVGLALGPVLFCALLLLPPAEGMAPAAARAAAVGALMAVWWVTEAIPIPATALLPLVLFPLLGVQPIAACAAPYANPIIFLFLGGFLIARALAACGLHRRAALAVLKLVGARPANIVGGVMVATALISMWVSNTATVVMMYPLALSVIELTERQEPRIARRLAPALLLGLAYAANIGGLGTLIGTPPNALLAGFMSETYGREIGFAQWMLVGVPLVAAALPLAWLILVRRLHPLPEGEIAGGREALQGAAAALGPASRAEWTVGAITGLTAACWIARPLLERALPGLSDAGIAIAGALLMFLIPIERGGLRPALRWAEAEEVPWSVLILFGGGLSLAQAISASGLADWIAGSLTALSALPLLGATAAATAVVLLLTELTSNTATAAVFLPIMGAVAVAMGVDPVLLAVPVALAASCAFMMPVATPPNAIVFGAGRLTIPQMATAGVWLNLLMLLLINAAVMLLAAWVFGGG